MERKQLKQRSSVTSVSPNVSSVQLRRTGVAVAEQAALMSSAKQALQQMLLQMLQQIHQQQQQQMHLRRMLQCWIPWTFVMSH